MCTDSPIDCENLLRREFSRFDNPDLDHDAIKRWCGLEASQWTAETCCLADAWFEQCKRHKYYTYERLPDNDDITKLSEQGWNTIREIKILHELWQEISEPSKETDCKNLKKQVRKGARRPEQDRKWPPADVRNDLEQLKIVEENDNLSVKWTDQQGISVLFHDKQHNRHDIFPLFKAYVFYTSNSLAALRIKFKWKFPRIWDMVQGVGHWIRNHLTKAATSPAGLTFVAFFLLFFAFFMTIVMDYLLVFKLTSVLLICYLAVYIIMSLARERHRWLSFTGVVIVLLYFSGAAWIISPGNGLPENWPVLPDWLANTHTLVLIITLFAGVLQLLWFIIWAKSIREHFVLLVVTSLISAALLAWSIGLESDFIAHFAAVTSSSLGALGLLHFAQTKLEDKEGAKRGSKGTTPLHEFLNQVASSKSWSNPFKNWRWPNGLLFTILFSLALSLFFRLFVLEQTSCCSDEPCQEKNLNIQISYPSWLSDHDQSTIYATTGLSSTLYFEPINGSNIFFKVLDTIYLPPTITPTPTSSHTLTESLPTPIPTPSNIPATSLSTPTSQMLELKVHSRWEIHTLSPAPSQSPERWEFQVYTVNQKSGAIEDVCTISIPRLRLPFGLRGFLETQPFVTIVGILYGLAHTALQLWVGEKAFGDGS